MFSKSGRNRTSAFVLTGAFLALSHGVLGQTPSSLLPGSSKTTAQAQASDPLKRNTPRSSIYNFLETYHNNDLPLAAQYLDLRKIRPDERKTQGPELARELAELLDRDPRFEVSRLNNTPEGDLVDGLTPDLDNLHSFALNGQPIVLQMQRQNQQGVNVWVVSAESVARIPQLAAMAGESSIEKKLPQPLVTIKFIGTPLWVWLSLVLMAAIISLLSRVLSRLVLALIQPVLKRYSKSLHTYRLETFVEPLRLLLTIVVFRACMEAVPPSALVRDYLTKLLWLLFILGVASLIMRIVDVVADRAASRLDPRQRALSYSVIPLFARIVKIFIFCIAILFTLERWGYSTSTILAGVGVGGVAIALAAQKTIENLFGSLSIISDQPVLVGDFCQFGGQVGTVEDIGLRSTRIRTLDRTVVTIPNSVFSTMTLENFSKRDRMWFHPTLRLRRDTLPRQIREMMDAITKILQEHSSVDASGVPLRFTKVANDAFDLEIFAYVLTPDFNEFLKVQSELLLKITETAQRLGVGFAVPFQESITKVLRHEHEDQPNLEAAPTDGSAAQQPASEGQKARPK
jgi:MscS family membrane protein